MFLLINCCIRLALVVLLFGTPHPHEVRNIFGFHWWATATILAVSAIIVSCYCGIGKECGDKVAFCDWYISFYSRP